MLTGQNRIATIETQIAAGLIEEVIQVAQAELELVDVMAEHQVYVSRITYEVVNH